MFCYLGLFPNAGQDYYYLNAPRCREAVLRLSGDKTLTIRSNAAPGRVYIQSCRINGKEWNTPFVSHREIGDGGTIEFELSDTPTTWGRGPRESTDVRSE